MAGTASGGRFTAARAALDEKRIPRSRTATVATRGSLNRIAVLSKRPMPGRLSGNPL